MVNVSATVSHDSCYAKIVPTLISDLDDAMGYSWADNEHGYFYGTYTLDGIEDIYAGTAMELLPGATVKLPLNASLRVYGSLLGGGTSDNHATITSSLASPYAGCWYAVKNYGTVDIEYTDIGYASNGVKDYSGADETEMDYCSVDPFKYYGIRCTYGSMTVRNCTVENSAYSSARGIFAGVASALVDECVVQDLTGSTSTGIYVYYADYVDVTDNEVSNSSGRMQRGIYVYESDNADVLRNEVSDCALAGVDCYNGADAQIMDNTIADCDVSTAAGIAVSGSGSDDVLVMCNYIKAVNGSFSAQYGLYCHNYGEMIVRLNTIEDFNHSGIYAASDHGGVDCGSSSADRGYNDICWNLTGSAVVTGSYWINNAGSSVDALYDYYGTPWPSASNFTGSIDWDPYLTSSSPKRAPGIPPVLREAVVAEDRVSTYPNPVVSSGAVTFRVKASDGAVAPVRVAVYDRYGAMVRLLDKGLRAPGQYERAWDGCDGAGRRVIPGLYCAVAEIGSGTFSCQLMVE